MLTHEEYVSQVTEGLDLTDDEFKVVMDSYETDYLPSQETPMTDQEQSIWETGDVPKAAEEEDGFFANAAAGAVERMGDLAGNLAGFIDDGAMALTDKIGGDFRVGYNLRGEDSGFDMGVFSPEEVKGQGRIGKGAEEVLTEIDLGYTPEFDVDRLLESDGFLEGAINTAGLIVEQGIVSAPDMAALILTPGSYLASRSQELSNERAKNNGREEPTADDRLWGSSAAIASITMDKFGLSKLKSGDMSGGLLSQIAKKTGYEAGTEGIQEVGEYAGTNVGTDVGFDIKDAGKAALGGALGGAGIGGVVGAYQTIKQNNIRKGVLADEAAAVAAEEQAEQQAEIDEKAKQDALAVKRTAAIKKQNDINAEYLADQADTMALGDVNQEDIGMNIKGKPQGRSGGISVSANEQQRMELEAKQEEEAYQQQRSLTKAIEEAPSQLQTNMPDPMQPGISKEAETLTTDMPAEVSERRTPQQIADQEAWAQAKGEVEAKVEPAPALDRTAIDRQIAETEGVQEGFSRVSAVGRSGGTTETFTAEEAAKLEAEEEAQSEMLNPTKPTKSITLPPNMLAMRNRDAREAARAEEQKADVKAKKRTQNKAKVNRKVVQATAKRDALIADPKATNAEIAEASQEIVDATTDVEVVEAEQKVELTEEAIAYNENQKQRFLEKGAELNKKDNAAVQQAVAELLGINIYTGKKTKKGVPKKKTATALFDEIMANEEVKKARTTSPLTEKEAEGVETQATVDEAMAKATTEPTYTPEEEAKLEADEKQADIEQAAIKAEKEATIALAEVKQKAADDKVEREKLIKKVANKGLFKPDWSLHKDGVSILDEDGEVIEDMRDGFREKFFESRGIVDEDALTSDDRGATPLSKAIAERNALEHKENTYKEGLTDSQKTRKAELIKFIENKGADVIGIAEAETVRAGMDEEAAPDGTVVEGQEDVNVTEDVKDEVEVEDTATDEVEVQETPEGLKLTDVNSPYEDDNGRPMNMQQAFDEIEVRLDKVRKMRECLG